MTQNHGAMRELYPAGGDAYRFHATVDDPRYTFGLATEASEELDSAIVLSVESSVDGEGLCRTESGRTVPFAWAWVGAELHLWLDGGLHVFQRVDTRRRGGSAASDGSGDVLAPMPGSILEVLVRDGDRVERNQTVMLMESMKMELVITAPRDGVVRRVSVEAGQQVERGMRLLELTSEDADGS